MGNQKIYFAGDHNAGLHPKVIEAVVEANEGKVGSYREDEQSRGMGKKFDKLFGQETVALLFSTGTAANIASIAALTKPYHSVICPRCGHINTYETGGPTRFSGCSLEVISTKDGKINIEQIEQILSKKTKENFYSQPRVVFITQPTEYGVLWTPKELNKLSDFCKRNSLFLFMDGARIANAVAKLCVDIREFTTKVGIDVLTWGGIKNGGLADALVFLNTSLASDVEYIFKQLGQDVAKSRYYSATVNALLESDLWVENARHANEMAIRLYDQIKDNEGVKLVLPVETNFIWSVMSEDKVKKLNEKFVFYQETNGLDIEEFKNVPFFSRFVTSWATTEKEVDSFARAINSL